MSYKQLRKGANEGEKLIPLAGLVHKYGRSRSVMAKASGKKRAILRMNLMQELALTKAKSLTFANLPEECSRPTVDLN